MNNSTPLVEPRRNQRRGGHDDDRLRVGREPCVVGEGPHADDQRVEREHADGGDDVGEAQVDEHVVEVGLVGVEGRLVVQHAREHDAHRVEDGDRQHGQREGDHRGPLPFEEGGAGGLQPG